MGNKGGVGISINLDGTTLLFMNAHLAGKCMELECFLTLTFLHSSRRSSYESCCQHGEDQGPLNIMCL